jgi:hypothetical protein
MATRPARPPQAAAPAALARATAEPGSPAPQPEPPVSADGTARPLLRVVRSDTSPPAADAHRAVPATASASSTAALLARATAGAIEYEDDGRVSVLFPPPSAVFAASGATVAREESAPAAPAPAAPGAPAAAAPAATGAVPAPAAATLDRDELYADFMRRLRRDVLEQREQLGEL